MTTPEVKTVLQYVRELLEDESKWTKGASAKNGSLFSTDPKGKFAERWCLAGAIIKHSDYELAFAVSSLLLECLQKTMPGIKSIVSYNDYNSTSHKDILALLDAAILACDAEETSNDKA